VNHVNTAVIGTGVIGTSWAAYFLSRGMDVIATDPAPEAEVALRAGVAAAWPSLIQLGLHESADPDRLSFTTDVIEAVTGADFVQENGPERLDIKQQLIATIDAHTPAEVIIASSSSGTLPSEIQALAQRFPDRVLIGHPFHPAHLMPLVEVVGGSQTSLEALDRAMSFYASIGKKPIRVRQELPGHIANRLQAALWREAYSLVERGAASVADIDTAISYGPGLRWALLGPLVLQHLSGGPGGMAHLLRHLGPPTQKWMDDLGAPQLNPELAAALVAGVDAELAGIDQQALVAERDALLIELLNRKAESEVLP
jgi:carnitine 3-dehydrogenase